MTQLLLLAKEFFLTGLFAVGGGLATIPFVYKMAARYGWISEARIADMLAVAESTPGPIGVNLATYTGFTVAGPLGALTATLSLVFPSLVLIILLSRMLEIYRENRMVNAVFAGLRPAAAGLVAAAAVTVLKVALYNPDWTSYIRLLKLPELALFVILFIAMRIFKAHPIVYIAVAGGIGIILKL